MGDTSNIRPVKNFNEKFHAMAQLCSKYIRKTKNSPLTALRMGAYCKTLQGYNLERGYSFISQRTIAEELGCSQAAVSNALKWLEAEGYIERVDNRKANKVGRYVILIKDDYSHEHDQPDKALKNNHVDKVQESNQTEQSHKTNLKRNNGTQVKLKESGPSRCGSRRKAAVPSRGPSDADSATPFLDVFLRERLGLKAKEKWHYVFPSREISTMDSEHLFLPRNQNVLLYLFETMEAFYDSAYSAFDGKLPRLDELCNETIMSEMGRQFQNVENLGVNAHFLTPTQWEMFDWKNVKLATEQSKTGFQPFSPTFFRIMDLDCFEPSILEHLQILTKQHFEMQDMFE